MKGSEKQVIFTKIRGNAGSRSPLRTRNIDPQEQLNQMKKQNKNLKEELEYEQLTSKIVDKNQNLLIDSLQQDGIQMSKKLEIENKRQLELNRQIEKLKEQIMEKKKIFNGIGENSLSGYMQKQKTLDHRQDKYLQKNNELFATILKTKESLKASRRERVIFDNIFTGLESDLKKKEEDIKLQLLDSLQIELYHTELRNIEKSMGDIWEIEAKEYQQQCETIVKQPNKVLEDNIKMQDAQENQNEDSDENLEEYNLQGKDYKSQNKMILERQDSNLSADTTFKIQQQQELRKIQQEIVQIQFNLDKVLILSGQPNIEKFLEEFQQDWEQSVIDSSYSTIKQQYVDINNLEKLNQDLDQKIEEQQQNLNVIFEMDKNVDTKDEKEKLISNIQKLKEELDSLEKSKHIKQLKIQELNEKVQNYLEQIGWREKEFQDSESHLDLKEQFSKFETRINNIYLMEKHLLKDPILKNPTGKPPFDLTSYNKKAEKLSLINEYLDGSKKKRVETDQDQIKIENNSKNEEKNEQQDIKTKQNYFAPEEESYENYELEKIKEQEKEIQNFYESEDNQ